MDKNASTVSSPMNDNTSGTIGGRKTSGRGNGGGRNVAANDQWQRAISRRKSRRHIVSGAR
jgi:hypothetical protein